MKPPLIQPLKLLFVCSRNRIRSLTAEKIFDGQPGIQARSAGTQPDARIAVSAGQIGWADIIFVMQKSHLQKLRTRFAAELANKRVVTLHIPDEFTFMQPELVDELRAQISLHLNLPNL